MDVSISGSEEVQQMLRASRERIFAEVPIVMQEELNILAIDARNNHRFTTRTGRLENSIEVNIDAANLSGSVSLNPDLTSPNGKDYGRHIHNGTAYMAADPFLTEASDRQEAAITEKIQEAIWDSLTRTV